MSLFSNKNTTEKKDNKEVKGTAVKAAKSSKPSMKDLYKDEAKAGREEISKVEAGKKTHNFLASNILIKPLVTEKSSVLGVENKYLFVVSGEANKIGVAGAVESVYGVKPVKVNIINVEGKSKRRGRIVGKRKDWKKAIVTLPKGKTIKIYEGI